MEHRTNPTWSYVSGRSQCVECGDELPKYSRSDKLFCGDVCRKRHSRRPAKVDAGLGRVHYELQQIRHYLKSAQNEEHIQKTNDRLKFLREEIGDILRLRDRETIVEAAQRAELIAGVRKGI